MESVTDKPHTCPLLDTPAEALGQIYPELGISSFSSDENLAADCELAEGTLWSRRAWRWEDSNAAGEAQGLCVNVLRIAPDGEAELDLTASWGEDAPPYNFEEVENAYWQTVWATGALRIDRGETQPRLYVDCSGFLDPDGEFAEADAELLAAFQDAFKKEGKIPDEERFESVAKIFREAGGDQPRIARFLPAVKPSDFVNHSPQTLAAINGGFFLNFPEEYNDPLSALHQPVGLAVSQQHYLMQGAWVRRPAVMLTSKAGRALEMAGPDLMHLDWRYTDDKGKSGREKTKLSLGVENPTGEATIWRSFDPWRQYLNSARNAIFIRFTGSSEIWDHVIDDMDEKEKRQHLPHFVPEGGALVCLRGATGRRYLENGTGPVDLELSATGAKEAGLGSIKMALAAGPFLVRDGKAIEEKAILTRENAGEFFAPDPEKDSRSSPPPTRFPYDAGKTRAPRSAIGLLADGSWIVAIVDGRADTAHSVGATLGEMGRIMEGLGCKRALNLDGGGSSTMAIKPEILEGYEVGPVREGINPAVVNLPSDAGHRERVVPLSLTLQRKD